MSEHVSAYREAITTGLAVLVLGFASLTIRLASGVDISFRQMLFCFANACIVAGYGFVAIRVVPLLPVRAITRYGAMVFFLMCALTHMDQIVHTLGNQSETWGEISGQAHMLFIHLPQALAVWVFAVGFFLDLDRLRQERRSTSVAAYVRPDDGG